jgi:hypothetical protein
MGLLFITTKTMQEWDSEYPFFVFTLFSIADVSKSPSSGFRICLGMEKK